MYTLLLMLLTPLVAFSQNDKIIVDAGNKVTITMQRAASETHHVKIIREVNGRTETLFDEDIPDGPHGKVTRSYFALSSQSTYTIISTYYRSGNIRPGWKSTTPMSKNSYEDGTRWVLEYHDFDNRGRLFDMRVTLRMEKQK